MRKTFISFHSKDENYKNHLSLMSKQYNLFHDESVKFGDIDDTDLNDEQIRKIIRDDYLRETEITILLVGECTKHRRHVDWEIATSMIDGELNKKAGIVVVLLPSVTGESIIPSNKIRIMVDKTNMVPGPLPSDKWRPSWKEGFKSNYPSMPQRIVKNIIKEHPRWGDEKESIIPILNWSLIIKNPNILKESIEYAFNNKEKISYDTSIPFKRDNTKCEE